MSRRFAANWYIRIRGIITDERPVAHHCNAISQVSSCSFSHGLAANHILLFPNMLLSEQLFDIKKALQSDTLGSGIQVGCSLA